MLTPTEPRMVSSDTQISVVMYPGFMPANKASRFCTRAAGGAGAAAGVVVVVAALDISVSRVSCCTRRAAAGPWRGSAVGEPGSGRRNLVEVVRRQELDSPGHRLPRLRRR